MAFAFGLQTHWLIDFTIIFQFKGLKPKNKGHTNLYECCDLTKKSISNCLYFVSSLTPPFNWFSSAETGLAIPRIENNVCQYVALQLDSNPSQTEEMSCNEYINRTIEDFNSNNYQITTCEKSDLLYDETYVTSSLSKYLPNYLIT